MRNYHKSFLTIWRKGRWLRLKSHGEDVWQSREKKYSLLPKRWAVKFDVENGEVKYVDECRGRRRVYKLNLRDV